jgi:PAS domain S-box-containing protein
MLLQLTDFTIIQLDESGKILNWNPGTEEMYGYVHSEIVTKSFSLLYNGDIESEYYLEQAIIHGKFEIEGWANPKNAQPFYATTTLSSIYDSNHVLLGFVHTTRDITDKKKLEEENIAWHEKLENKVEQRTTEMELANRELEAFSYSVSHDLRTPLRAISGYSLMLQEDYAKILDSEANRLINAIVSNSNKMGNLIDDLLAFSRMGRLTVGYNEVSMERLVGETLTELLPLTTLQYNIETCTLASCNGDAGMLKQVWINLIGNAIKYSSNVLSPTINIGYNETADFHIYFIKDNGAGFDMKYASKLFGVFQRLHHSDEFDGTGLGLALAKRIVDKHGGDMWGEGKVNEGCSFYFSIPKQSLAILN